MTAAREPSPSADSLASILERLRALEAKVSRATPADRLAMVVFSGSLDRQIAAFTLATTAAASGMEVDMFFTFWGLAALRDPKKSVRKPVLGRLFGWMLPRGTLHLPLSQMNMAGAGALMIRAVMKKKNLASLEELMAIAADTGVRIWACDMSRSVMGIEPEELLDYPNLGHCGAASFLERAAGGKVTLFL